MSAASGTIRYHTVPALPPHSRHTTRHASTHTAPRASLARLDYSQRFPSPLSANHTAEEEEERGILLLQPEEQVAVVAAAATVVEGHVGLRVTPQRVGGKDVHPPLGQLMRNLTNHKPAFTVTGLQAGQEFSLVIQASNREGSSPPTVLSAFTLRDNAQTVIGVSSGGEGRTNKGGGGAGSGGTSGSSGGNSGVSVPSSGNGGGGVDDGEEAGGGGVVSGWVFVPPMMLVLAASLSSILLLALIIIIVIKRRGRRSQRVERQLEQVKLSGEALVPPPSPQEAPRRTPGSRRKQLRGEGVMDEGSCAGSVCGSGSRETVLDGGGEEGEIVCGTTVAAEVEVTEGTTTTGGGIGGEGESETRLGAAATVGGAGGAAAAGTAAGGIMIGGMGLFDNSGSCNGGLLPSVSTASPMDIMTGSLQEGVGMESAPLPLLGVTRLGRGVPRQQQVLYQEVPVLGVGGLVGGGLDPVTSTSVGAMNLGVGGMPRMVGVNMGGMMGAGVGNPCMGVGPLGGVGGMGAAGGLGAVGRLEAGGGGGYVLVRTPGIPASSSSPTPPTLRFPTYSPAGFVRQNLEDTSLTHPNESMSSL
ncbi:WAG22 antigen-like [Scylla paramamosain]|uniref:WAG22 antigen-like n=1 Tax=Scylla paramamosain TaxID=85552 RepID=UPI003083B34F